MTLQISVKGCESCFINKCLSLVFISFLHIVFVHVGRLDETRGQVIVFFNPRIQSAVSFHVHFNFSSWFLVSYFSPSSSPLSYLFSILSGIMCKNRKLQRF